MNILYESIIYVNHRGHDRGKKNTGERVMGGGAGGGWGGSLSLSLSLSLSGVFLSSVVASMVHIYDRFI